jgi:nucleoside-diphosphate-sugar epimerase
MAEALPTLILTGASGLVGRNFLLAAQGLFRIYAIARRSQRQTGIAAHPNVTWIQVDIADAEAVRRVSAQIKKQGGADYVIHLAAYYDFDNEEHPEFHKTNVEGTRHLLEAAKRLAVKHFLFSSSIAACEVPEPGDAIREESPPDARFPYARSKRAGEELMAEYSHFFRCSIVRLAAVFSDWCEYAPLYVFFKTWLSNSWRGKILGGRGTSAVPYIHARDINRIFLALIQREDELPSLGTYIASPDGATSHRELFERATQFHFNRTINPFFMPKPLAWTGVFFLDVVGRLVGRRPFERPWMMEYLDRPLSVDASRTREILGWSTTPRLHLLRRTLFLIEKMKSDPQEWTLRNERAMKAPVERPHLIIHDAMVEAGDAIADAIVAYLQSPVRHLRFPRYAAMPREELRWYVGIIFQLLMAAVRTGDRAPLMQYIQTLAHRRHASGFPASELCDALLVISETTIEELLYKPKVTGFEQIARDSITMSIALAIDGVQDEYETIAEQALDPAPGIYASENGRSVEQIVAELNAFYRPSPEDRQDDGVASPHSG